MATQELPTVGSKVLVSGGTKIGSVKALVSDERGKEVVGMTVESGLLRHHVRLVALDAVKWVNADSVVLRLTRKHFEDLPEYTEPAEHTEHAHAAEPHHGSAAG